jgi:hypothetical protein
MARAYRGIYSQPSQVPPDYASARIWGTGVNPVHEVYGEGQPLRTLGRDDTIGSSPVSTPVTRDYQDPRYSSGVDPPEEMTWGYPVEYGPDSFGHGPNASPLIVAPATSEFMDDRPAWNEPVESQRVRGTSSMTPWSTSGAILRAVRDGAHRYRLNSPDWPVTAEPSNSEPNETVSEGWLNKATSFVAYSKPSAPSQYEIQTSMAQRFLARNNDRSVMRGTDEPRYRIESRVQPMIEKVYSEGSRLYDMFPMQAEVMERPFRNRTAGTGPSDWMEANEWGLVSPIQRTPPPDPSVGVPEVSSPDYGYTGEDVMYYG